MPIRFKRYIHALLLGGVFFASPFALAAENGDATQQLIELLKPIKTLRGEFSQESRDVNHMIRNKQHGTFKVKSSGEFVWEISQPYEQKIVSDGKLLRMYDPDLKQVTVNILDADTQVVPLLLFSEKMDAIKSRYFVSATGQNTFELSPQSKNTLFEKMVITFSGQKPVSLLIFDGMKQETEIQFQSVMINEKIQSSSFELQLPADVDVIDERQ